MNTLKIRLSGADPKTLPGISVDGQLVKCKKNSFGSYEATVQTEGQAAEIGVFRYLELRQKGWWLFALLSFLVSVFGIFEPGYGRKFLVPDVRFRLFFAGDAEVVVRLNPPSEQRRAAELETYAGVAEIANVYLLDKVARRRRRVILAVKIVSWVALAFAAVYLLSKAL